MNISDTDIDRRIGYLDQSLGFLVNGLARLMRVELEAQLREVGLTPTTWTVLIALGEQDQLSQTDLARKTYLDGATITRALDLLEAKGKIERRRDNIDRRVQIVALTEEGQGLIGKIAGFGAQVNDTAAAPLTRRERNQLEGWLRQLIEVLQNHQQGEMLNEK